MAGEVLALRIKIENDLFDINARIKEIEQGYFIMYNTARGKYEVHHKYQPFDTYCLTLPYDSLDARAVEHVLKTRTQNAEALFEEMERQNAVLEGSKLKAAAGRCSI